VLAGAESEPNEGAGKENARRGGPKGFGGILARHDKEFGGKLFLLSLGQRLPERKRETSEL